MNTPTPQTAVARPQQKRDIRSLLQSEAVKAQLALVLPKHMTADRMARVACTAVLKTPKLAECSPESLLQAMMLCSQAGLEPDGRNAHLIPYGNQVQVIFDYKGLIALARRNGIKNISADVVCDGDTFEWNRTGDGLTFRHIVDWRKGRGEVFAAFCIWKDGEQFDGECMTKAEIEAIRKRSRAVNSGPWVTDWFEMAKKTVVRRASKKWPLDADAAVAVTVSDPDEDDAQVAQQPAAPPMMALGIGDASPEPSDEDAELEQAKHSEPIPEIPPTPRAKAKTAMWNDAQTALGDFVVSSGFTFDDFKRWGNQSGNLENADSLSSFDDVPRDVALRLMRAKDGLKTQLAAVKGGVA